jgi:hypothetical protein
MNRSLTEATNQRSNRNLGEATGTGLQKRDEAVSLFSSNKQKQVVSETANGSNH